MPKPKSSEEARILRYFREEDLMKVQLLGSLVVDIVKTRTKVQTPPVKPGKKKAGPEVVAGVGAGTGLPSAS